MAATLRAICECAGAEQATLAAKALAELSEELTAAVEVDTRAIIQRIGEWNQEREGTRVVFDGEMQHIAELEEGVNPVEPQCCERHLDEPKTTLADLTDRMDVRILSHDSSGPFVLLDASCNDTSKKTLDAHSKMKTLRQQMRRLILLPSDCAAICVCLTKNNKFCLARNCRHTLSHQLAPAGTLVGGWACFLLAGSLLAHLTPVFCCSKFLEPTTTTLKKDIPQL